MWQTFVRGPSSFVVVSPAFVRRRSAFVNLRAAMPLPLDGKTIAITRAREQAGDLAERLRALGAEPVICPAIAIAPLEDTAPLDAAISRLGRYDWLIVTSVNGARALCDRMAARGVPVAALRGVRVGAVGPATAAVLAERGIAVDFVPSAFVAEAILAEIGDVAGRRILLPRADIARETLVEELRARGAQVDDLVAYRTIPGDGAALLAPLLRAGAVDAVTFASSSAVRYLLDGLTATGMEPEEALACLNRTAIICIGPVTAATARRAGLRVTAEACESTAAGVAAALCDAFRGSSTG
jgi:uroporphyrinogen-III synthase